MIVRKRAFHILLVGAFGLLGTAPATTARGQTIVVTAKSVKDLAGDLEYLIKVVAPADDPGIQGAVDGLKQFQAGELVKGLDQARGFGLAVSLPKDFPQGGSPSVVAAVPVSDYGQFLDSLKNVGLAVDDQPGVPGFSHKISGPDNNPTLFALNAKGYALLSLIPDGSDQIKEMDPSTWAPKGRPSAALSARVRVSDVPQALKDQFAEQMDGQMRQQGDRNPGEKDAEYRARMATQNLMAGAIKGIVQDGDIVEMDIDLDRKAGEMSVNLSLTGKPGSDMAKNLAAFKGRQSRFREMGRDAPLGAWISVPMAKDLRDAFSEGFESLRKADLPEIATEDQKKLFNRFVDLAKSELSAPELDYGLAVRQSAAAGGKTPHYVIVGGMKVKDGRAFDRLLRDGLAQIKMEKGRKLTLDVAKAADGSPIHQMTKPYDKDDKNDANVSRLFGEASLSFAFREDAILFAFGEDGVKSLRTVIEGLSSPAPAGHGPVEPVAVMARVSGLGDLGENGDERKKFKEAATQVFQGEDAKRDRASLVLGGEGDGIRLRLAVDVPALKFLATVGHETQVEKVKKVD